uniref:Uncharacterized protein n=1 Tax=Prymnesium polylepis TaxID=72548 RepID=A0A7S4IFR5_9EUKA|mmetsp:Transcript_3113/g.7017  ORF Transcript_3113/g.7017 Transcript_3113/m.7017 type:complete len:121 (+) Transcript_3113:233-595(+)
MQGLNPTCVQARCTEGRGEFCASARAPDSPHKRPLGAQPPGSGLSAAPSLSATLLRFGFRSSSSSAAPVQPSSTMGSSLTRGAGDVRDDGDDDDIGTTLCRGGPSRRVTCARALIVAPRM